MITAAQRRLLQAMTAAPSQCRYHRSIGRLQTEHVSVAGEALPRSAASFRALEAKGFVDRWATEVGGHGSVACWTTPAGRAALASTM